MSEESDKVARIRQAIRNRKKTGKGPGGDEERCSFCGKKKGEVGRLIAGPSAWICNECIAECNRILGK